MNNIDRPQLTAPFKTPRTAARGFTLIEILIVIALTAVLFALLIIPLVSALRYTQQAQLVTAAQDAARITKERITRELGSAVFVFDGTSHPFQVPIGTTPTAGDDKYTNFLDLQMMDKNGIAVVAHAYNAKLDFVLPKLNDNGAAIDPTTNEPIAYTQSQNGSAIISNPSFVFPLAAGTNATRYFVGLKDPTKPYNNTREGKANATGTDNTYILYRAEYQPYIKSGTSVTPNAALFATRPNPNNVLIPELDDPDFFRYVSTSDVNWLNDAHPLYTAMEVTAHNGRVDKWVQISKPVIPGPNVDLLLLPHNADNTLAYDGAGGAFPNVAHSGAANDPVTGTPHPIVNTSVTFRPATISGNATPGTTSEYNSSGVVSVDQAGFSYIPTVYTATSQSWSLPFHVSVSPGNFNQPPTGASAALITALSMYYDTDQFTEGQTAVTAPATYTVTGGPLYLNPGDILEYRHLNTDANAPRGALVYDITQGFPVKGDPMTGYTLGGTQFVPVTINPDSGTFSFAAPSLPNGPYDRYTRQWNYIPVIPATPNQGGIAADGSVDLTLPVSATPALTDSPLAGSHILTAGGTAQATGVDNAHLVPGSVRVTGPDQVPGPNLGQPTTYSEVSSSVSVVGDNQFSVDYSTSTLHLVPGTTGVGVIYDYQANMTLTDPTATFSPANVFQPMQVKVDYQTRDLIDVNIGVRIYDVTTNRAQVLPTETKIKIGNSNR